MNCVGHLSLEHHEPSETNDAAKEGTAIGEYLSAQIEQDTVDPKFNFAASNGVFINDEMKYHARNVFHDIKALAGDSKVTTEVRIDWYADSTIIRGQYDISFVTGGEKIDGFLQKCILHIEDLKYGWGIVEVKENWQLIGYAIGRYNQLIKEGIYPSQIAFRIHQPRPYHEEGPTRSWTITKDELFAYYHKIVNQVRAFTEGDKTLTTGSSCKYCDAAAHCPSLNRAFHKAVDVVLTDYDEKVLTNEDIVKLLDIIERAEDVIKIKSGSIKQLAMNRIQNNQVIQGYGIVQKYGDRKWKDGVTADTIKAMTGVDVTKIDVMSPAQAEKAGVSKKLTTHLTFKPSRGFELSKVDIQAKAQKLFGGE